MRCTSIDRVGLERDRDQIWAEAVHLYRQSYSWHITDPDLLRQAQAEQAARYDADVWQDRIAEFVIDKDVVTITEVMEKALFIDTPHMDRRGQNRVMKTLRHLGWEGTIRVDAGRRGWVRSKPND